MITLAFIVLLLPYQTQLTAPCRERPAANDKTYMTMNAASGSFVRKDRLVNTLALSITPLDEKRFWDKVDKTENCWLWRGCVDHFGYGRFGVKHDTVKKTFLAHRVSFLLAGGSSSVSGCVLHKCDVPNCVAPHHLYAGTRTENSRDMVSKGRSARGERHSQAVLKDSDIPAIRAMWAKGVKQKQIAKMFSVTRPTISMIVNGHLWSHVK